VGNPFLFTGRELDAETGLYHYRARTYDPAQGRFKQRDPFGIVDGLGTFEYVASVPTSRSDPSGAQAVDVAAQIQRLGHDSYRVREGATDALFQRPETFVAIAQALAAGPRDVEIRSRLSHIVERWVGDLAAGRLPDAAGKTLLQTPQFVQLLQQRLTSYHNRVVYDIDLLGYEGRAGETVRVPALLPAALMVIPQPPGPPPAAPLFLPPAPVIRLVMDEMPLGGHDLAITSSSTNAILQPVRPISPIGDPQKRDARVLLGFEVRRTIKEGEKVVAVPVEFKLRFTPAQKYGQGPVIESDPVRRMIQLYPCRE
jgi:RHS repeat-associated protein